MNNEAPTTTPGVARTDGPAAHEQSKPTPQISGTFPEPMRAREQTLLDERRSFWKARGEQPTVITGLALSGGGIRSATFCLGFMQSLARRKLLHKCDYLSTVSGGGYAGAFLGAWINRSGKDAASVEDALPNNECKPVRFLRNNGRYLAPNGNADAVTALSAHLRSWFTVWLVLGSMLLGAFLLAEVVKLGIRNGYWKVSVETIQKAKEAEARARSAQAQAEAERPAKAQAEAERAAAALTLANDAAAAVARTEGARAPSAEALGAAQAMTLASERLGAAAKSTIDAATPQPSWWQRARAHVTLSAFFQIAGWVTLVFALPIAVTYWFVGRWKGVWQLWLLLAAAGVGLGWWLVAGSGAELPGLKRLAIAAAYGLAVLFALVALVFGHDDKVDGAVVGRNRFTDWLARCGMVVAGLVGFAAIDTIGQSLAAHGRWWASAVVLPGLAALAQWALPRLSEASKGRLPAWLGGLLLPLAAAAIALLTFGLLSMSAHLIAARIVAANLPTSVALASAVVVVVALVWLGVKLRVRTLHALAAVTLVIAGTAWAMPEWAGAPEAEMALPVLVAAVVVLWLAGLMGLRSAFVNASSHHRLYSARLTRTFLGASNPWRTDFEEMKRKAQLGRATEYVSNNVAPGDVTTALPGDQVPYRDYAPHARDKGGPLHLINATVNETISGISNIEQRDRHGFSFAVGPAGLNVRTCDHAEFHGDQANAPEGTAFVSAGTAQSFHTLAVRDASTVNVEMPPVGAWIGISGAAFTTGLGARTNLAFSFLLGFFNVRLGYWWDSGVPPHRRAGAAPAPLGVGLGYLLSRCFRAQAALFDEFMARFHGPARRHWYLSDGGHFENCAVYELIRRRVPLIVCCDCGADPAYEFDDVANLVRKARIDFGAQIEFMSATKLKERLAAIDAPLPEKTQLYKCVGLPEELKPNPLTGLPDDKKLRAGFSEKHVAVADVVYGDPTKPTGRSILVVVKPTLSVDAPMDLRNYDATDSDFPQQSTLDQFFDEAQWESYRRLGEFIGEKVFGPSTAAGDSPEWTALRLLAKSAAENVADGAAAKAVAGTILVAVP